MVDFRMESKLATQLQKLEDQIKKNQEDIAKKIEDDNIKIGETIKNKFPGIQENKNLVDILKDKDVVKAIQDKIDSLNPDAAEKEKSNVAEKSDSSETKPDGDKKDENKGAGAEPQNQGNNFGQQNRKF